MKQNLIKLSIPFLFCILLFNSCSKDPQDSLIEYEKIYNSHNIDGILGFYSDNVIFEIVGVDTIRGKEGIKGMVEYSCALNTNLSLYDFAISEDTIYCNATEINDVFQMFGINFIYYQSFYVLEDGLITKIHSEISPESAKLLNEITAPFYAWVFKERTGELDEMSANGKYDLNAKNAKKEIALIEDWSESKKQK
jgi:hypothetical protein